MSIERTVEEQVKNAVQSEIRLKIAKALSEDPEKLVRHVVEVALTEKKGYGSGSIFADSVNKMIREAAREEFRIWLDENRGLIRKAIKDRMKKSGDEFVEDVAEKLVSALSTKFYVSIHLTED
jgi:hypothetical protein